MSDLYQAYIDVGYYPTLPVERQREIVDLITKPQTGYSSYYITHIVDGLYEHLDKVEHANIVCKILSNIKHNMNMSSFGTMVVRAAEVDLKKVKKILYKSKFPVMNKMVLALGPLSLDEEVRGLRAIAKSKWVPDQVRSASYAPTIEALKKLPPVMRLNAMENLCTKDRRLGYNVFKHLTASDFDVLLFSVVIKHNTRISELRERFNDLKFRGRTSKVKVEGACNTCGPWTIEITNNLFRTESGFKSSYFGSSIMMYGRCPLCGRYHDKDVVFSAYDETGAKIEKEANDA